MFAEKPMNIAVIGSGIAGLACAWKLSKCGHIVSLYEANDYFGGHTHTIDVTLEGHTAGVDTGFLVFNHRTYPNLVRLFDELNIQTTATDMSFSAKLPVGSRMLEWAGNNLDTVFTQRRNIFRPSFLRMLRDIMRFNKQTTKLAKADQLDHQEISLGDFLSIYRYSYEFANWYLLPMAGCIWSCPTEQMMQFPLNTFVKFCHNHGLLQITNRPQWYTVKGGASQYVKKMLNTIASLHLNTPVLSVTRSNAKKIASVYVKTKNGVQTYDHVVLACHSDQSLQLLADASVEEVSFLSAVRYQPNLAVLHTDISCLPSNRKAWAAWNYESTGGDDPQVCVHYLINRLQPLPFKSSMIVSLNPIREPDPSSIIDRFDYAHPIFDIAAINAQKKLQNIQGKKNTWFAGAWTGYGFHEDGLKSGLSVANAIENLSSSHVNKQLVA